MRIYNRVVLDSQRRVNLGGFIDPESAVAVYMESGDDKIYVEVYDECDTSVPEYAIRRADIKCRVSLPKWMLNDNKSFDVSVECEGDPERIERIVLIPGTI